MLKDEDPRGTVEEMVEKRIDTKRYGSCSRKRRDEDGKVVVTGCPVRKYCDLPEKDGKGPKTSGCSGHGPCRVGCFYIKVGLDGTKTTGNVVLDCFHLPGFRRRIETRGHRLDDGTMEMGHVEVVAREGDVIELAGTEVKDVVIPGQGTTRNHEVSIIKTTIQKFPRPGEPGNFPGSKMAADAAKRVREEMRQRRPAKLFGVEEDDGDEAQTG